MTSSTCKGYSRADVSMVFEDRSVSCIISGLYGAENRGICCHLEKLLSCLSDFEVAFRMNVVIEGYLKLEVEKG